MIISIHQPDYISYLGYFYKISKSDVFVFLDDCQFSNNNMHNWNRIKTPQGECRLKIPVEQHLGTPINQVRTKDELKWKEKHLKTIQMNYSKAQYYQEVYSKFEQLLLNHYSNIAEMNIAINTWIIRGFGFKTKLLKSSEMEINTTREERVIDIVKLLNGDTYISGIGAKNYEVDEHFSEKGITLIFSDYKAIPYHQLWSKVGFLPYMSVLDYIFNYGFDWEYVSKTVKELNYGNR